MAHISPPPQIVYIFTFYRDQVAHRGFHDSNIMTRWKWKRPYYYFKSHILPIQDYRLGQPRMQTMMYTTISCVHHCIPIDVCIHINYNRVIVWMFSIPVPLFFLFPIFDSINMGKNGSKKVGTNVSVTKNMFNVNIMWKWNTNDCFSVQNLSVCGAMPLLWKWIKFRNLSQWLSVWFYFYCCWLLVRNGLVNQPHAGSNLRETNRCLRVRMSAYWQ